MLLNRLNKVMDCGEWTLFVSKRECVTFYLFKKSDLERFSLSFISKSKRREKGRKSFSESYSIWLLDNKHGLGRIPITSSSFFLDDVRAVFSSFVLSLSRSFFPFINHSNTFSWLVLLYNHFSRRHLLLGTCCACLPVCFFVPSRRDLIKKKTMN